MLERLKKLKSNVRYYVANYENNKYSNTTVEKCQLVKHIILLLKPFFFVTEDCSKNNSVLSSVIPHARSLTKIINFYESSEEVSNVCKTLTENIGEACERRFYIYYNNLKPNDNKLKPITTALDP